MNEEPHAAKREIRSPEDQSLTEAQNEAKHRTAAAAKAGDEAEIAKAELSLKTAEIAYDLAKAEAEHTRDQKNVDKTRVEQSLRSATQVRSHRQKELDDVSAVSLKASHDFDKAKIALDEAEAAKNAADGETTLKSKEYEDALSKETDLKKKLNDLKTADEAMKVALAQAKFTVETARLGYAQEIAKLKKAAADRVC